MEKKAGLCVHDVLEGGLDLSELHTKTKRTRVINFVFLVLVLGSVFKEKSHRYPTITAIDIDFRSQPRRPHHLKSENHCVPCFSSPVSKPFYSHYLSQDIQSNFSFRLFIVPNFPFGAICMTISETPEVGGVTR
jgi:hypothetical protein